MGLIGEYDTISTTGGWTEKWKGEMKEKSLRRWNLEEGEEFGQDGEEARVARGRRAPRGTT